MLSLDMEVWRSASWNGHSYLGITVGQQATCQQLVLYGLQRMHTSGNGCHGHVVFGHGNLLARHWAIVSTFMWLYASSATHTYNGMVQWYTLAVE